MREHEKELGVTMVPFKMMVYVEDKDRLHPRSTMSPRARASS